jgi:site-specific DNA-cytosine methylase
MVVGELTAAARVTALEFYSGIGGLHYGLLQAAPHAQVLDAFDLSDVANATYEHNFGIKPAQVNIGALSVAKLSSYGASTWLMSPPCQPYTRKGLKKDSADGRARSFLDILDLLPKLSRPPKFILIENVVGFEASDTRERLLATLSDARYVVQEFILSPLQFGIPYSRPRYFCIAKQAPLAFVSPHDPATNPPRTSVPTSLLPVCSCRGGDDDPYSPGPDTRYHPNPTIPYKRKRKIYKSTKTKLISHDSLNSNPTFYVSLSIGF